MTMIDEDDDVGNNKDKEENKQHKTSLGWLEPHPPQETQTKGKQEKLHERKKCSNIDIGVTRKKV